MSDTVDTRVVKMEFDNKQFEKNIKKTSQSLNNLKQNLDFEGVGDSINEVKIKISALEIAATTFVANIANRLTNLSLKIVKSLSVDNISSGWTKFGDKTVSVATMMAQKIRIAGQEISDLGEKTSVVSKQLELLNWFSDETSYSFNDMVDNVGKFTAAGQDLDTSVEAMEGIATWAALSGQNASTASRAMYQLAQAMGKGKIQLIDWKSIQNANMDTEEFREKILESAVSLKELRKEGDQFITKTGKKFTQSQFTEQLTEGWFTSDVLTTGLKKYSSAISQIYAIADKENLTASDVIEKYGDQLDPFGVKAFKAAQEARTFADALNSVKDAVSSKWLSTFENIFGTKDEAVKLWTDLANELYDVFTSSAQFVADITSVWKTIGGRETLFARGGKDQGAFWNIYDAIIALKELIKSAWNTVFPLSEMDEYSARVSDIGNKFKDITIRIQEFTKKLKMSETFSYRLSKIFQGLFNILKVGITVVRGILFVLDPVYQLAKQIVTQIVDVVNYYGNKLTSIGSGLESMFVGLRNAIAGLLGAFDINGILSELIGLAANIIKIISDYNPIKRLIGHVKTFVSALTSVTDVGDDFGSFMNIFKSTFKLITKILTPIVSLLFKIMPVVSKLLNFSFKMLGYIVGIASKLFGIISKIIDKIISFFAEGSLIDNIKNAFIKFFEKLMNLAEPLTKIINKLANTFGEFFSNILVAIPDALKYVTEAIENSSLLNLLENLLLGMIDSISAFMKSVGSATGQMTGKFGESLKALFSGLATFAKSLIPILQIVFTVLGKLFEIIGVLITKIANTLLNALTGKDVGKFVKVVAILGVVALAFRGIYLAVWAIKSTLFPMRTLLEVMGDACDAIATKARSESFKNLADSLIKMSVSLAVVASINEQDLVKALSALSLMSIILIAMLKVLNKMSSTIISTHRMSRNIKEGFAGILDQIGDVIHGTQRFEQMGAVVAGVKSLVNSMLKISVMILLLSRIKEEDIMRSMGVALGMLTFLATSTVFAIKSMPSNSAKKAAGLLKKTSKIIIPMMGLAIALKQLSNADPKSTMSAGASIVIGIAALITVAKSLDKFVKVNKQTKKAVKEMLSLSASLVVIATAIRIVTNTKSDWAKILVTTGSMILVIKALGNVMTTIDKNVKNDNTSDRFKTFAKSLIPLSIAMTIISGATKLMGMIDTKQLVKGVFAIGVLSRMLSDTTEMIDVSNTNALLAFSVALVPFAASMVILSGAVAILGKMRLRTVVQGGLAVITFIGIMALVSKAMDPFSATSFALLSVSLMAFGQAMLVMSGVIAILGNMNPETINRGINSINRFVVLVGLASHCIGIFGATNFTIFTASLIVFGQAMLVMSGVIAILGNMDPGHLWIGISAIAGFVALIGLASNLFGLLGSINFAVFSTSLLAFGQAMLVMSGVIAILSLMKKDKLWSAWGIIISLFGAISAFSAIAGKFDGGSAFMQMSLGMMMFAAAMIPLTGSLMLLSVVPWTSLLASLGTVTGLLLAFCLAVGKFIAPTANKLTGLGTSLMILGLGLLSVGMGLSVFSASIPLFAASFVAATGSIILMLTELGKVIFKVLVDVINYASIKLHEATPYIISILVQLLYGLADVITSTEGVIAQAVVSLLDAVLIAFDEHAETIFKSLFNIIIKFMNKLIERGPELADKIMTLLYMVCDRIIANAPIIFDKVMTFLEVLGALLLEFRFRIIKFLAVTLISIIGNAILATIASLGTVGQYFVELVSALLMIFLQTCMGLNSALYQVAKTVMYNIFNVFGTVFKELGPMLINLSHSFIKNLLAGIVDSIAELCEDNVLLKGLVKPLRKWSKSISESAKGDLDENILSGANVMDSVRKSAKNIQFTMTETGKIIKDTTVVGIGAISSAVDSSISVMKDSLTDFGKDAGNSLTKGLSQGSNIESAKNLGNDIGDSVIEGYCESTETHSPSRVFARLGGYLMQGLSMGITNSETDATNAMTGVISDSLSLANHIINDQNGTDLTISVGMDISNVEAQSSRIQDIMSSVNNPNVTPAGINANYNSSAMRKGKSAINSTSGTTNNSNDVTYNNTFNISSTDPSQSAEEIDKVLQQQAMRKKMAHGM